MDAPCARESDKEWILLRYARWMKSSETANDANVTNNWEWKIFSSGKLSINLTKEHHLIIKQDTVVLENHSLWNSRNWIRAHARGDSMIFVLKIQNEARKFRIQFSGTSKSGAAICQEFVEEAKSYFFVKVDTTCANSYRSMPSLEETASTNKESENKTSNTYIDVDIDNGACNSRIVAEENPVGKIAQVLKESGIQALPIAYQNTNIPNDDNILDMIIGLCLTDSNFPAFVNRVEQRIKDITSEAVQPAHTSDASDTSTL